MKLHSFVAAFAAIAAPVTIGAQPSTQQAEGRKAEDADRVVCEVTRPPGSRLGGVRRCRTRAEWEQYRAETRDVVHRVQAEGATFCSTDPAHGPHC